jgi:ribonuclease HI
LKEELHIKRIERISWLCQLEVDLAITTSSKYPILCLTSHPWFYFGASSFTSSPSLQHRPLPIDHCLFSCPYAARLRRLCGLTTDHVSVHGTDNLTRFRNLGKKHGSLFFIVLWLVWCARNAFVFENTKEISHTLPQVATITPVNPLFVSWTRPMEGIVCLNVDGSLLGTPNTAGYGGLIRDNNWNFVMGFYGAATVISILFAELMAVLHGLQLCWENGFKQIMCYSDSLQTISLIRYGVSVHHRFANEVASIRQLLARDWDVVVDHTLREGNACADVLAKMGALVTAPLVTFSTPSSDLALHVLADA